MHIPYHVTWAHEDVSHNGDVSSLTSIRDLRSWLARRDDEGTLVHEELAVRIGALLAFWLSDEYLALATL